MQSAAAVALMPLLIICWVHRSSDSQCFLLPSGSGSSSNTWLTKSAP